MNTSLVIEVALLVFVFNIPFGYWRANVKKFSWQWALSIHIPVPIVILLRIYSGIGYHWATYPFLVGGFFLGQYSGKLLFNALQKRIPDSLSSCLVMDVFRLRKN
jgi:hypothetical protein